jgi:hypothetical protein
MVWDWTAISAIGSVIGSIGGVTSIVFLVLEVRRNAQAIEGSTVQALMIFEKDVFALIADNAEIYLKGCAAKVNLSAVEKLKFERIVSAHMSLFYSAFVQFEQHLIDDEVWAAYVSALKGYLIAPGFKASWKAVEHGYPLRFRDLVNG